MSSEEEVNQTVISLSFGQADRVQVLCLLNISSFGGKAQKEKSKVNHRATEGVRNTSGTIDLLLLDPDNLLVLMFLSRMLALILFTQTNSLVVDRAHFKLSAVIIFKESASILRA